MHYSTCALVSPVLLLAAVACGPSASAAGALAGDPEQGKTLFLQSCVVCHSTGQDGRPVTGQGPLLAGVVGRPAASLSTFGYTKALQESHLVWDVATLERFLSAPTAVVPGTNMVLAVPDEKDRANIIAFLATLRPVAAPTHADLAKAALHSRSAGDWQNDAPGTHHRIEIDHLPAPYSTRSAGNSPHTLDRPANAHLSVPPGFQVKLFASELSGPRLLRVAPNGDIFIAETRQGRIRVLRAADGVDSPSENLVFADKLRGPFGLAFYPATDEPRWLYVGNNNSVVRFPYQNGDLKAQGKPETVVEKLSDTTGGHSTRDVVFSVDGKRLFISVGSGSNVAEQIPKKSPDEVRAWQGAHALGAAWGAETNRADVLVTDPEGHDVRVFAVGIRNPVGLAIQPSTGDLWTSANERDGLGDDLVPDYITRVREGGYYGWPWYYLGKHEDPRLAGARPDLVETITIPDVPVQAHSASLQLTFYPDSISGPSAFPKDYRGDIFAAFHGSWNRTGRTGSKVIRVHLENGKPTGEYEDFLTGFVIDDSAVWGRPVGVAVAHDGALLVTDDANGTLWRISYAGVK